MVVTPIPVELRYSGGGFQHIQDGARLLVDGTRGVVELLPGGESLFESHTPGQDDPRRGAVTL